MSYVVLLPKSNTNHSDKFRVVDSDDWMKFVNGAASTYLVAGEFDTLKEAETMRDQLNSRYLQR